MIEEVPESLAWHIRKEVPREVPGNLLGMRALLRATQVSWETTKGLPEMPSPLFYQGRVHFVRDGAMWTVIAPRTGQRYLDRERLDIGGQIVASPIAGNALYVRSADYLWAYGDKPR